MSLDLIRAASLGLQASIIDVGGGTSTLVDSLLDDGYTALSVLDLSGAALAAAQARLGARAAAVRWIEADITTMAFEPASQDLWRDRAVFHFLNEAEQRAAYVRNLVQALKPHGLLVIGTFADNSPEKCTGLSVQRYTTDALYAQFCADFVLVRTATEAHRTPSGSLQPLVYCWCRRRQAC